MALEEAERSYKMWEHEREHMEKHRHHDHHHHGRHHDGHHRHHRHQHHHKGDGHHSRDHYYVADEVPIGEAEPVEYIIKHDEKKHGPFKRAKKYAKKLIEDPEARQKAKE